MNIEELQQKIQSMKEDHSNQIKNAMERLRNGESIESIEKDLLEQQDIREKK